MGYPGGFLRKGEVLDPVESRSCLEGLAAVAGAGGQLEQAALLLGAAEAQRAALGVFLSAQERAGSIDRFAALLAEAGDAAHAGQRRAGQVMPLEEVIALAAEEAPER